MAKNLLIVESPAKAKTINRYLGPDFEVLASYGHVRDLPSRYGAVDTENPEGMLGALQLLADKAGEEVDVGNAGKTRSVFMDIYSLMAKAHMKNYQISDFSDRQPRQY